MKPTHPVLRYYGAKWRLALWIIRHMPVHTTYVEPFCGAAGVFFRKPPAEFAVLNDLDSEIINFFHVLRERTDDLIHAILATPYSRAEYNQAYHPAGEPLERARRYYIRVWQGWGGSAGKKPSGWRYQHSDNRGQSVVKQWNRVEHLQAIIWRLKQAFIENDEALNIIERYDQPHTLFYLDPPYLPETRSEKWANGAYRHETDEAYHHHLLDTLQEIQGMAIISGYPSTLYDEKLATWSRFEKTARTTNTPNTATEVIWISPAAMSQGRQLLPGIAREPDP